MDNNPGSSGQQPLNGNSGANPAPKRGPTYLRPSTQRIGRRRAPPYSKERFDAETLGGRLWHSACQEGAKDDFTGEIPLEFTSIEEYIATFDPLVLEEAREGLKADWAENCAAGRTWRVEVISVEGLANGWSSVRLRVQGSRQDAKQATVNNTCVVLSLGRPPQRGAIEWAMGQRSQGNYKRKQGGSNQHPRKRTRVEELQGDGNGGSGLRRSSSALSASSSREGTPLESANRGGEISELMQEEEEESAQQLEEQHVEKEESGGVQIVAGLSVRGYRDQNNGDIIVKIHPCCAMHAGNAESPCCGVLDALRRHPHAWWLTLAGMLVTSEREFDAVHAVRSIDSDLMEHILKPSLLREIGKHYENDVRI